MQLAHITFTGPPIDDPDILGMLPTGLAGLLRQLNGFIQFHGGLHVRAVKDRRPCDDPITPGANHFRQVIFVNSAVNLDGQR